MVGYHYAEKALIERLEQRETDTRNLDIIVYINRLSEEKDNKVQQTAQVLNLSKEPVNWLLYLKSNNQNLLKNNQNLELGHYYRISGKTNMRIVMPPQELLIRKSGLFSEILCLVLT